MYTSSSIHPYFSIPSFIFIGQIAQWLMLFTVNKKGLGSNPSLSAIKVSLVYPHAYTMLKG